MADLLIDCVDGTSTDPNGEYRRRILPAAIHVNSVGQMVSAILDRLRHGDRILRLRIFAHGNPGWQGLGHSATGGGNWYNAISLASFGLERSILGRLCGHFAQGAWVELSGCRVGACSDGRNLLIALAQLWNVHVAAGIESQSPDPGIEGTELVAWPNGSIHRRAVHKPSAFPHTAPACH